MHRARLIVLVLAAASALAVAACGGDTEESNDYVDAVNEVTAGLQSSNSEITSAAGGSPADVANVYAELGKQTTAAATELEGIEPPEDVADLHATLISQVQDFAAAATNAADEIEAGGPASVTGVSNEFLAEANKVSTETDSTLTEINNVLQE